MNDQPQKEMSLFDHLSELRKRLFITAIILVVGVAIAAPFSKIVFHWLQQPLVSALPPSSGFITLSPVEGWLVYFKVALVSALFGTSPLWLYQLWAFIAPGLHKHERSVLTVVAIASAALFIGGAYLCYALIIPNGFQYFVSILDQSDIALLPQMHLYFSFMLRLLIAFGIVFEIPLVIIVLVRLNIVSLAKLRKARRYVIVIAFVIAAIITPPDVFTQIALAIPFIALFELSLIIAWFFKRRQKS